ncbi:MAG TPA: hypothetical protein VEK08_07945 [Planctomycetota bacterium]|nr:hypothetical protein [Planctomycetota bacterium]
MSGKIMLALALTALIGGGAYAANDDFVRVEMKGKLHSDREGGRATLEAKGRIYELDFGGSRSLANFAERHDRDFVRVIGTLDLAGREPLVIVDRMEAGNENVAFERRHEVRYEERPVVRERHVIREKDDPFFKVGPLEIGN